MATQLIAYHVFISSPAGLEGERSAFHRVLSAFNQTEGLLRGIQFLPVGWEKTLAGMGRPQDSLKQELEETDFMVVILPDRWGTPTERGQYHSGVEEEFKLATRLLGKKEHPMKDIAVFFKELKPTKLSDTSIQLKHVHSFRQRLEQVKLLYQTYTDEESFMSKLTRLLHAWSVRPEERNRMEWQTEQPLNRKAGKYSEPPKSPPGVWSRPAADEESSRPPTVFICYARKDNEHSNHNYRWLDRLLEHLHPLALGKRAAVWSDKDIEAGDDWHVQIQKTISDAKASVLLISPAFLNSEYIRSSELPVLLKDAKDNGLVIIPVIVRPCLFKEVTFSYPDPSNGPEEISLSTFQSVNDPKKALSGLSEHQQDLVLLSVAQRILRIVRGM